MQQQVKSYPSSWVTYKRLFSYIRDYWYVFAIAVVGSVGYSAVDAWLVKFLQQLIDQGLVAREDWFIQLIPIVLPAAFLARGIMNFASDYSMSWVARHIVTQMRKEIFQHLQKLPATFYDQQSSGELLSRLNYNTDQVAKAATDVVIEGIRDAFLVLFLIAVMFWTSWQLTLTFLIAAPAVIIIFVVANKRFRKLSRLSQVAMAEITHIAEENIEGYKVVRIFGGEAYETQQFSQAVERTRRFEMKNYLTRGLSVPAIQVMGGFAIGITIYFAMNYLPADAISVGAFATLAASMIALLKPLKQISAISNKIQRGLAGAESVFELLDTPAEFDSGTRSIERVAGAIEFKHLNFAYRHDAPNILQDINFSVKPGERIALVGRSGSGKSTIINLLTRFYDNYVGTIKLDNFDIRTVTLSSLRQQFAVVTQQVTLFNDTIANNITYGSQQPVDMQRLHKAAIAAHALEFIEKLPAGFASMVGENGILLSGGQRQRLAIARAIYKDAPILILDEATSALDTESERHIQLALEELMHNRTTLIIAHRLSTIEKADHILVLADGQIIEQGTHQQLLQLQGHYAHLCQMQAIK